MRARLRLFVSAGPDMEAEREAIGKALAALPVSLGWVIKRTPRRGEPLAPALEMVEQCDFYVLLMGYDITAPVGVEWMAAQRTQRTVLAFLKRVPHTPAAQIFIHHTRVKWTSFADAQELGSLLQRSLAIHILERAADYGLSALERKNLSSLVEGTAEEEKGEEAPGVRGRTRGEAGGGGVILAPERDLPSDGVLVGEVENKVT